MLFFILGASRASLAEVPFTSEQVDNGAAVYEEHCQLCHGTNLNNGQFAPPIKGPFFQNNWEGKSLGELARLTYEEMPPNGGKSLPVQDYLAALAFILEANGIEAGSARMTDDFAALDDVMLPW